MESPMTRVFNLSELMVGSFGVSDPVTGGVVKSFCRLNEQHQLSIPTAFPSRNREKGVRLRGLCQGIYTTICTYWWHRRCFILSYTEITLA